MKNVIGQANQFWTYGLGHVWIGKFPPSMIG
jgi:hypothetical protein